jgi:hypothetical protein
MSSDKPDSIGAKINSHLINVIASFPHPVGDRFNPTNVYRSFFESLPKFLQSRGAVKQALNLIINGLSIYPLTKPFRHTAI